MFLEKGTVSCQIWWMDTCTIKNLLSLTFVLSKSVYISVILLQKSKEMVEGKRAKRIENKGEKD